MLIPILATLTHRLLGLQMVSTPDHDATASFDPTDWFWHRLVFMAWVTNAVCASLCLSRRLAAFAVAVAEATVNGDSVGGG